MARAGSAFGRIGRISRRTRLAGSRNLKVRRSDAGGRQQAALVAATAVRGAVRGAGGCAAAVVDYSAHGRPARAYGPLPRPDRDGRQSVAGRLVQLPMVADWQS